MGVCPPAQPASSRLSGSFTSREIKQPCEEEAFIADFPSTISWREGAQEKGTVYHLTDIRYSCCSSLNFYFFLRSRTLCERTVQQGTNVSPRSPLSERWRPSSVFSDGAGPRSLRRLGSSTGKRCREFQIFLLVVILMKLFFHIRRRSFSRR